MEQHDDQTQVTADIIAGEHASSNGFGAMAPEMPVAERPEMMLGAAFVGGFLFARIVRRLAS
jgi:hypothetical protein